MSGSQPSLLHFKPRKTHWSLCDLVLLLSLSAFPLLLLLLVICRCATLSTEILTEETYLELHFTLTFNPSLTSHILYAKYVPRRSLFPSSHLPQPSPKCCIPCSVPRWWLPHGSSPVTRRIGRSSRARPGYVAYLSRRTMIFYHQDLYQTDINIVVARLSSLGSPYC